MYTFISLFIYVVLNVFIALIEESFFSTAEQNEQILKMMSGMADENNDEHADDDGSLTVASAAAMSATPGTPLLADEDQSYSINRSQSARSYSSVNSIADALSARPKLDSHSVRTNMDDPVAVLLRLKELQEVNKADTS